MNAKIFSANNLPNELLLITRQTAKLRNAIENNMSTDIKLTKAQISKIIFKTILRIFVKQTSLSINESSCGNCKC